MGGFSGGGSNPFGSEVDLSEMATIADARIVGNNSGGASVPLALTAAQVLTLLGISVTGKIAQLVHSFDGAVATGTTTIPWDDTIPQSTEGTQFYSVAITPTNASSKILGLAVLNWTASASNQLTAAIFKDSVADAIAAATTWPVGATTYSGTLMFPFCETAGNMTARTYKLRAGGASTNTLTINGSSAARKLGGIMVSGLFLFEVLP